MDTDMFVIVLGLLVIFLPLLFVIFTSRNFNKKFVSSRRNEADANLENLYKIQNYEFWRDFGKRGEQTKAK